MRRVTQGLQAFLALTALLSCQTSPEPHNQFKEETTASIPGGAGPKVFEVRPPYNQKFLDQTATELENPFYNREDLSRASVQNWVHYFAGKNRERFARFLKNGAPYRKMIEATLKKHGLPQELYYLPLIESGYRIQARSRASAVGPWQFMRSTGKRFGLTINAYVDERRDPVRATIAAATYLKRLYKVFGSWPLALSAYNAGESRVMNAILNYGTRDFWSLCAKKALPRETRSYFPKLLAAINIGHNYHQYDIPYNITQATPKTYYKLHVPSPIKIREVAKIIGTSASALSQWNPHILRGLTPPGKKTYHLWSPIEPNRIQHKKLTMLNRIPLRKLRPSGSDVYYVKKGDSLSVIARKFATNIRTLKSLNHIRGTRIQVGQKLNVPTYGRQKNKYTQTKHYRVRAGDNLYQIAKKFNTSVGRIKRINNIASNRIYAGQLLRM
ncbi:MAG: LysM peptidoglycan-binding domain-containing protein [Zetaproteobacteria bacterium]|nr:LysM peptidoglycan-binding domain-containing protein [Zetaproteobacteria bacterium]